MTGERLDTMVSLVRLAAVPGPPREIRLEAERRGIEEARTAWRDALLWQEKDDAIQARRG